MPPEEKKSHITQIIVACIIIFVIVIFGFQYFASSPKTDEKPNEEDQIASVIPGTPQETISLFYEWYINGKNLDVLKNPTRVAEEAEKEGFVTNLFTRGLPEKVTTIFKEGIDVITCTDKKPETISFKEIIPSRSITPVSRENIETSVMDAITNFDGHFIKIQLEKLEGKWMIHNITCPVVLKL